MHKIMAAGKYDAFLHPDTNMVIGMVAVGIVILALFALTHRKKK